MPTYRWTIPDRLIPVVKDEIATIPDRVTTYLTNKGLVVDGVTVQNRVTIEGGGDVTYLEGPFLRVEADADPSSFLDTIDVQPTPRPNLTAIKALLATVDAGTTPTNAATLAAVVALCRAFMVGRGSGNGSLL